jgi:superfamily II DNA or RNA helicase
MNLRPHQVTAIDRVRASMCEGHRRVVLVVPTGGGKTIIAADVARRAVARGTRVLFLAHRTELITQAVRTFRDLGLRAAGITAAAPELADGAAPVQTASIQTLLARGQYPDDIGLLIWDECHHAAEAAETWVSILDRYPDAHVLGLTATPERGDGSGLGPLFTAIVVGATVRDLTADGHLVPCDVIRPATWLKRATSGNPLAQDPVKAWLEHAGGRQGFLFARTVEEAHGYARGLSEADVRAIAIDGKTSADVRSVVIEAFRAGHVRVLCNVYVFTEGTDLPMASVCCLARGAATAGTFLQMTGRVLRPAPGKSAALLIDLQGVSHLHGVPEDDRVYRLEGRAIARAGQLCPVCSTPIDDFPCPTCGHTPEASDETSGTTITLDPLVKYARKIAESPEQRYETAVRWLRAARLRGHKPSSVRFKWRAVYQADMPREMYARALAEVDAAMEGGAA